ncbi:hypothetical protein MHLNE_15930 [Moorella humiferrea]|uniref:5' nucleotidase, NT5C type n=1 Tax=Neomoorella humiferrea TaxID=676965 RepID=UPI0030CF0370
MRVGVDIDNTIANLNAGLLKRFNVSLKVYPSPELPEGFFATPEGMEALAEADPLPGAVETLRTFSEWGHEIFYITSRPPLAISLTRNWLETRDFPRGAINFVPRGRKRLLAQACNIDLFFEDDPREVKGLAGVVPWVCVPAWPYNTNTRGPGIYRFSSWQALFHDLAADAFGRFYITGKEGRYA